MNTESRKPRSFRETTRRTYRPPLCRDVAHLVCVAVGKTKWHVPTCLRNRRRWNCGVSMMATAAGWRVMCPWMLTNKLALLNSCRVVIDPSTLFRTCHWWFWILEPLCCWRPSSRFAPRQGSVTFEGWQKNRHSRKSWGAWPPLRTRRPRSLSLRAC